MKERSDIQRISAKWGVRFLGEREGRLYFKSSDCSAERRDDLSDLLHREVVLVDGAPSLDAAGESEAVQLSRSILDDAVKKCCSDVHIEPTDTGWQVRMRLNGTLFLYGTYPESLYSECVTRLKLLCGMDIGERRRPQDGRYTHKYFERRVDMRASTIPVLGKEKLVLRLLDRGALDYTPKGIGLVGEQLQLVETLLRQPLGLVLLCGPTGSGKTSTLYTFLKLLNTVERNILTIEDPVEFAIEGINQMQVNPKAGITFATGLESMLRQDPEVMMVGEIRSKETAEIALRASITGHLIFSTLHTTDSPSAILRLLDMGIEPYMISAGVIGIISQRLVRKLCPYCKEPIVSEDHYFGIDGVTYKPQGCKCCDHGYNGREAVFEMMLFNGSLREKIRPGLSLDVLREEAICGGMVPLKEALKSKVEAGTISLDEAYRTIMTM